MIHRVRSRRWLVAFVAAFVALAGCVNGGEEADEDGADGVDGTEGDGAAEANVASATLLSPPESVAPGEEMTVCWHVDGTGNVPHVALHWGTESHEGDNVTFQDYENVVYPGNETEAAAGGYDLPGDFCAAFQAPATAQTVYYRGHAMIEPPGVLTEEGSTTVGLV